jgi:hypothetical protein
MTLEKMECMKYIYEKKDQWVKSTSWADSFRKKFLNPAVSCLEKRAVLRNTSIQIPINSAKNGPTLIITISKAVL